MKSKNQSKLKKKLRGFTLIEILLAIFVLEIGLLGVAGFYTYSFQVSKMARNQTTASNLAAGILDGELSKSYDSPDLVSVAKTAYSTAPSPFSNYQKQIDVNCINADLATINCDANAHMKKIVITIYWQEGTIEKSFQEATIITES